MGFIAPSPPPFDLDEWRAKPHLDRIQPLVADWGVNGFGTPWGVYLLYIVKCAVYAIGGLWLIGATTPGLGGLGDLGDWWSQPIVFQKAVVLTLLWEVVGLGSGSFPLTLRFLPPIGGILYWLRPGTIRLPPFPDRVPLTEGSRRTLVDVALYAAVLVAGGYLLISDGEAVAGLAAGRLDPAAIAVLLGALALLGLRDKVPFLAARAELYGMLLVVFLFAPGNLIVASQLVFVAIWLGAAASKLNRHFPFVVSVMISNTPWNPSKAAKARLYRDHPRDMRPSVVAAFAAHSGTVIEFTLPLTLLFTDGGTLGTLAVIGMVIFHVHIFSTFPLAVPLEWNLFMILGILLLFGENGGVALSTLSDPVLIAIMAAGLLVLPVLGNLYPDRISFLISMRYYAGNWATSQWLFRKDAGAEERLDEALVKPAPVVVRQLERIYGPEMAEFLLNKGLAFRSMHSHGRALNGLLPRAVDDVEAYHVREGELIAGIALGYNFGDGHFHGEQLLSAVQERCRFAPGDLRVVMLESQPAHKTTQHYRIHDAATGLVEEGLVEVADMVGRQPWLEGSWEFPVKVLGPAGVPFAAAPPTVTPAP